MIQRFAVMVVIVFGILMPCAGATAEDAPAPDDHLALATGTVLVSAAADPLRALALTDGKALNRRVEVVRR